MRRLRNCILTLGPILIAIATPGDAQPKPRQDAERAKLYDWIDSLGYDGLKSGQFVCVEPEPPTDTPFAHGHSIVARNGFLLKRGTMGFSILGLSLKTENYPAVYGGLKYEGQFHPADFRAWAGNELESNRRTIHFLYQDPDSVLWTLIMARACNARGLSKLADQFFGLARSVRENQKWDKGESWLDLASREYRDQGPSRIAKNFSDLNLSRKQLLSETQVWLQAYPSINDPYMVQTAELLKKMVAEDERHPTYSPADLTKLPIEKRVGELIFRLRDQTGWPNPWSENIDFLGRNGKLSDADHSPAAELARLGHAAVPQLLAALSNSDFTRARCDSIRAWPTMVPRVQEAAYCVLRVIAGRGFDPQSDNYASMRMAPSKERADQVRMEKFNRIKDAAKAWWDQVQSRGEEAMLRESVENARDDGYESAAQLIRIDPAHALASIKKGVEHAPDSVEVHWLMSAIGPLNTPDARDFDREMMLHSRGLLVRLEAAQAYARWDSEGAVAAMEKECDKWMQGVPDDSIGFEMPAIDEVIRFLAGSGRASAIKVLRRGLDSVSLRPIYILQDLIPLASQGSPTFPQTGKLPTSPAAREEYESAVEETLVSQLQRTQFTGSHPETRICDWAAEALADDWPARYKFDMNGSIEQRDKQRLRCLNIWRRVHSLPPISAKP